jgi:hypothetical protein
MAAVAERPATHQEKRHVTGHYRTLHTGKVVYVHDFSASHAIASHSRSAHLHERSVLLQNRNSIRVSNAADLRAMQTAAQREGVEFTRRRAGANHHGRQGAYDHLDFQTPEAASRVMEHARLAFEGHNAPIEGQGPAQEPREPRARAVRPPVHPQADLGPQEGADNGPDTDPAPAPAAARPAATEEPVDVDSQFARIFGERIETPAPDAEEIGEAFEAIFGKLPSIEPQVHVVSAADAGRVSQAGGFTEVTFDSSAIQIWNAHIKVDPAIHLVEIYKHFGPGGSMRVSGDGGSGLTITYNNRTRAGNCEITRHYSGLGGPNSAVSHSYFQVPSGNQGENQGKKLFAASMDFYEKIGIKKITVHANIDIGSYAWARYRFVPNDARHFGVIKTAVGRFRLAQTWLRDFPEFKRAIEGADPKGAWVIADHISDQIRAGKMTREENPMKNLHWYGHIDMTNAAHVRKVREYVGRGAA